MAILRVCVTAVCASSCVICDGAADAGRAKGAMVIRPFDYTGVTLEGGRWQAQYEDTREYYLGIPDDSLLKGFRVRAGEPAPGEGLPGWYAGDIFHGFGQMVSGLARMYAGSGDERCRDKVLRLVHGWGQCIERDGYFYYSRNPNAPHYIYDKTVCGLVDAYRYCGCDEALGYLSRITDWAMANLDRTREYAYLGIAGPIEWYTLSENLYRAYLATGDAKYRDFAQVWEYSEYWDIYAGNGNPFDRHADYHAYSHVNALCGASAAFHVTGEPRYLEAAKNAYDYLQRTQTYATGGYGPAERFRATRRILSKTLDLPIGFETQCGSWAAFKLAKSLIAATGEARYGDWIERLLYNGVGASLPMGEDGAVQYTSVYSLNASRKIREHPWSCCACSRPQAIADYVDLLYFRDDESLYVNLYVPSTVTWTRGDARVKITQETAFPDQPTALFRVDCSESMDFSLKFRIPQWLGTDIGVAVNGQPFAGTPDGRGWLAVKRRWSAGDCVALTLPTSLWCLPLDSSEGSPVAVLNGPVVLAFDAARGNPGTWTGLADIAAKLTPIEGRPMHYRLVTHPEVTAKPYYEFGEGEPYHLYLAKTVPPIVYEGWWLCSLDGALAFTNVAGASLSYSFSGTGARWFGYQYDDAGKAEVAVDGQIVAEVDQYGAGRDLPFEWCCPKLQQGAHTMTIRVLGIGREGSKGAFVNVQAIETID